MKIKIAVFALSVVWSSHASASSFDALYAFGDSTVDSGWWSGALNGQCGAVTAPCTTGSANKDALISNAIANGGTGAPVGVGLMNTQLLASDLGIATFLPANQTNGTNYAISGALSNVTAGSGNLNPNPNLPSTVQQISNYLGPVVNIADPNSLYLISSGGNDITYAKDQAWTLGQRETYLSNQAAALAAEIAVLQSDGAKHIVVYGNPGSGTLGVFWTNTLFSDLTNLSVNFIGANIAAMVAEVQSNPTAYGFTATTVLPGTVGAGTGSACGTQTGAGATTSGWGQWCANKTTASNLYASLTSANAEQTSFYSDDEHFSAAGQLIEANYVFGLIQSSETPLPATLPLFASGLGALGLLGWRRKRKAAAAA
jgi:outer membrane lipase/esterase